MTEGVSGLFWKFSLWLISSQKRALFTETVSTEDWWTSFVPWFESPEDRRTSRERKWCTLKSACRYKAVQIGTGRLSVGCPSPCPSEWSLLTKQPVSVLQDKTHVHYNVLHLRALRFYTAYIWVSFSFVTFKYQEWKQTEGMTLYNVLIARESVNVSAAACDSR